VKTLVGQSTEEANDECGKERKNERMNDLMSVISGWSIPSRLNRCYKNMNGNKANHDVRPTFPHPTTCWRDSSAWVRQ